MPFRDRKAAKRVKSRACDMCGNCHVGRHAAHIVDELDGTGGAAEDDWNALSLCPNCHAVFEDMLRPKLYKALEKYGSKNLPPSWKKSNKITEQEPDQTSPETA